MDLAAIAHELDAKERALMMTEGFDTPDALKFLAVSAFTTHDLLSLCLSVCLVVCLVVSVSVYDLCPTVNIPHIYCPSMVVCLQEESGNVDASGNFSVSVLREATKRWCGADLVDSSNPAMRGVLAEPLLLEQTAFVCNLMNHWFTVRKLGDTWWDLNSILPAPKKVVIISLSLTIFSLTSSLISSRISSRISYLLLSPIFLLTSLFSYPLSPPPRLVISTCPRSWLR